MTFRNLQVDVEDLPAADALEFQPLAPAYPLEVLFQGLLTWGALFLIAAVPALAVIGPVADKLDVSLLSLRLRLSILTLIPVTIGLLQLPLAVRRARTAGYALREQDIAYRHGVFFRKVVILPFRRVQHAEISSGPLQRRFGLASLKIYTAGASSVDLQIDGLTEETAARLRDHVTTRGEPSGVAPHESRGETSGDPDAGSRGETPEETPAGASGESPEAQRTISDDSDAGSSREVSGGA